MKIVNYDSVNVVYGDVFFCFFLLVCMVTISLSIANRCGGTTPLGERVYACVVGCMV